MKKNILTLSTIAFLSAAIIFTSCKKDDVTAPVVTITGSDQTISLQGSFTDLGATANDNKDGALAAPGSGNVDVNRTGTYQITYTATDAAGNSGTAVRNVTVVNDIESMSGTYTCVINPGAYTYTQTITASATVNKRIIFGKFGDYTGNTSIYADVNNTGVTSPISLSSQTAIQVGSPATDRTFSGTGARATANTFGLSYTETTGTGSAAYTEAYSK